MRWFILGCVECSLGGRGRPVSEVVDVRVCIVFLRWKGRPVSEVVDVRVCRV